MKVKEIMNKEVISVFPDTNAYEALILLQKRQISGLPVIDAGGKLVGMFTEKEIITVILPSYVDKVGHFIYQENPKAVKQKIQAFNTLKVKDVMRCDVITLEEETTLCEVARIMLTHKARRIPILNSNKEVIGIVARCDVVNALFSEYPL